MKVVIAGAGSVGRYMAQQLQASGHAVTLIDNAPAVVDRCRASGVVGGVTSKFPDDVLDFGVVLKRAERLLRVKIDLEIAVTYEMLTGQFGTPYVFGHVVP